MFLMLLSLHKLITLLIYEWAAADREPKADIPRHYLINQLMLRLQTLLPMCSNWSL